MDLEYYWYETSPFLYTATGGIFLGRAESVLSVISSVLLLTAGGTILFLRRRHTRNSGRNEPTPRTNGRSGKSTNGGR